MLTFVCFKWERVKTGFQLPAVCHYGAHHVNTLAKMLARHVSVPHRLVCVTDNPRHIHPSIEIVPLWDKCRALGGCYNRLYVFSDEARQLFGDRFICIDLDCVIVDDITSLFNRDDEFIINTYNSLRTGENDQLYNGSMFMVSAGARACLWDEFDPLTTPGIVQADPDTIGTDQAWIRHRLGRNESRWSNADGVYEARQIGATLKPGVKIVFFSGKRDPSQCAHSWVREHWR